MSSIQPPPSTPPVLPTVTPAPVVSVPNPPATLADLANGTLVRAEIIALLSRGVAEVETDIGNFQIRSNVALRVGAELDLQLLKNGLQPQFAVRAVDGHTLPGQAGVQGGSVSSAGNASQLAQSALESERAATTSPQIAGANVSPATRPAPLIIGASVSATLLPRPPGTEASHIQTVTNAAAALTNAEASSSAPAGSPTTSIVQNLARLDPAGTRVDLRLIGIVSNNGQTQTGVTQASVSQPGIVSGTVTAFTPSGHPIVDTPAGLLSLDTDADVRIGHKLTFAVIPPAPPRGDAAPGPMGFLDTFLQKKSWPTLEQAIAHLAQRAHEAALSAGLQTAAAEDLPVPQANSRLAHHLISTTSALSNGDIRAWLGDLANVLEQDQPDLFRRLNEEFAQLVRVATEPRMDDWRTSLIPFFTGLNMEPVQMHLRGEKSPKGEKKKEGGGSRFIIDLNLSNLGRFQLDGFMKERGETKAFDLIVRTHDPLPQRMRYDLNQIFSDFAEVAGLIGAITFQAHAQFVEVSMPNVTDHRDGSVVV